MSTPSVLIAPDSFKGTLTAVAVANALARGFEAKGWSADRCPLADGGEGTADALLQHRRGRLVAAGAHDPLGRAIEAGFALLADGPVAIVEAASASGLTLVREGERDAEAASSFGTGELIVAAARLVPEVYVAVGGTATTDGGAGALEAFDRAGGIGQTRLVCLCDVRTPWERAAAVFAPQKGADPEAVRRLEARLDAFAQELQRDPRGVEASGAGGGISGGLWGALGAELVPGASWILDALSFDDRARRAAAVVTGEGRLDATTAEGKVVAEVARHARALGRQVHAVVGDDASSESEHAALDLASVRVATTLEAIEAAGAEVALSLASR
jgi:glycerate 2-kinase